MSAAAGWSVWRGSRTWSRTSEGASITADGHFPVRALLGKQQQHKGHIEPPPAPHCPGLMDRTLTSTWPGSLSHHCRQQNQAFSGLSPPACQRGCSFSPIRVFTSALLTKPAAGENLPDRLPAEGSAGSVCGCFSSSEEGSWTYLSYERVSAITDVRRHASQLALIVSVRSMMAPTCATSTNTELPAVTGLFLNISKIKTD